MTKRGIIARGVGLLLGVIVVGSLGGLLTAPAGRDRLPSLVGGLIATAVIVWVVFRGQSRRRRLLSEKILDRAGVSGGTTFLAAIAQGSYSLPDAIALRAAYPFDSGSSAIGLVLRRNEIAVWGWRRGALEMLMTIRADQFIRAIRFDTERFPARFMIWWRQDGTDRALALIPIQNSGFVRRAISESDAAAIAKRIQSLGHDVEGL